MKWSKFNKHYLMDLKCKVQKYEWGKIGANSKVATLSKAADSDFVIEDSTPYAELWMGTHPNAPSEVRETGKPLSDLLKDNPQYLGENVQKKFGNELPFLFKILSVNQALSIQAHPDKALAEKLFKTRPDLYKDPNHKPELAIALTDFEALCGFRPVNEIQTFIKTIPELSALVGNEAVDRLVNSESACALKFCFKALMTCSEDMIKSELKKILVRFSSESSKTRTEQLALLFERLHSFYPDDIGCFVIYFLNYLTLAPNQALYLGANEPHAYLLGDCVECMACSDNVVRAGLTPKFKDVDTLCNMLTYKDEPAAAKLFKPVVEDVNTEVFKPPVPDFAVAKIQIPAKQKSYTLKPRNSASILLTIAGASDLFKTGSVKFFPADQTVTVENITDDLLIFQAMANV